MKKETSEGLESISADDSAQTKPYAGYVGLDVHKDSIAVAVAYAGREAPESWGTIPNTKKAVTKLVDRLYLEKKTFLLCYEAGPCGYALYQNLTAMGMDCRVVAPPRNEKIKTDRRDAHCAWRDSCVPGNWSKSGCRIRNRRRFAICAAVGPTSRRSSRSCASNSMRLCCATGITGQPNGNAGRRNIWNGWKALIFHMIIKLKSETNTLRPYACRLREWQI